MPVQQRDANRSGSLAWRLVFSEVTQAFLPGFRIPLIQNGLF